MVLYVWIMIEMTQHSICNNAGKSHPILMSDDLATNIIMLTIILI